MGAHTDPALHERWDLRFSRSSICRDAATRAAAVPLRDADRFRARGRGRGRKSAAQSAGRQPHLGAEFGSDDPLSIIREGSGYWKYIPTAEGIRFLTWYDYRTRFGAVGAAFDRLVFRPLMGWATAWSFDRLRLWLEQGVDPAQAHPADARPRDRARRARVVFAYQGLVPKLLLDTPTRSRMLRDAGDSRRRCRTRGDRARHRGTRFASALLVAWHRRWPSSSVSASMLVATAAVGAPRRATSRRRSTRSP